MRNIFAIAAIVFPLLAQAQGPQLIADTLDWHGYFPLATNNLWQYHFTATFDNGSIISEWYETWTVAGDTLIEGQPHFALGVDCSTTFVWEGLGFDQCAQSPQRRKYLRYDEAERNIDAHDENSLYQLLFWHPFRLNAEFNATESSGGFSYSYSYASEAVVATDTVETTVKRLLVGSTVPGLMSFAHGIGLVESAFSEGSGFRVALIFSRVGDREYGMRNPVRSEPELEMPVGLGLKLYPNPVVDHAYVEYELADSGIGHLLVYDTLGREVMQEEKGIVGAGIGQLSLDLTGLVSGLYYVVLEVSGQPVGGKKLIKAN